ncbi:unnamed protein product [Choristocarpus tenellus]
MIYHPAVADTMGGSPAITNAEVQGQRGRDLFSWPAKSFAFSDMRFVVPWLPVVMEDGNRLERLVITFYCAKGDVARVKPHTVYSKSPEVEILSPEPPQPIHIEYVWEQLPEEDPQAGIGMMVAVTLLLTSSMAVAVCNQFEIEESNRSRVRTIGVKSKEGWDK